jgi:hypothetical protein
MYRLKHYKQGWIVEVKIYYCFVFFKYAKWKHITHYSGLPENPYYYDTPEKAREGALYQIKGDINFSFYYPEFTK